MIAMTDSKKVDGSVISGKIKPECRTTQEWVTKDNISTYRMHPRARSIRLGHVHRMEAALRRGDAFEDPIIINLNTTTKVKTVIDGQHRMVALRNVLADNPNLRVCLHALQYLDLDLEGMNGIYTLHAKMVKQTLNDQLMMEIDQSPVLKSMVEGDFPVRVAADRRTDSFNLQRVLSVYFNRYLEPERQARTSRETFMYGVRLLTMNDRNRIAEILTIVQDLFGRPGQENRFCDRGSLTVLFKIYFHNVDKAGFDSDDVKGRLRALVGDSLFIQRGKHFDTINVRALYDYALNKVNARYRGENRLKEIPRGRTKE